MLNTEIATTPSFISSGFVVPGKQVHGKVASDGVRSSDCKHILDQSLFFVISYLPELKKNVRDVHFVF